MGAILNAASSPRWALLSNDALNDVDQFSDFNSDEGTSKGKHARNRWNKSRWMLPYQKLTHEMIMCTVLEGSSKGKGANKILLADIRDNVIVFSTIIYTVSFMKAERKGM